MFSVFQCVFTLSLTLFGKSLVKQRVFNVASRGARKVQLCADKHRRLAAASSWVRFLGGGGPYWAFLCGAGMFSPHLCGFSTDAPVLPPKSNTCILGLISSRRPRPDALIKI